MTSDANISHVSNRVEARHLRSLFFFFGLAILAIAPRTPDLERNLGISNAKYGVLVSLGAVGALFALFFMGQLVHRVGAKIIIWFSGTSMYGLMAVLPHIRSSLIYVVVNILIAVAFNSYAIALHDHALARQEFNDELNLPKLHGVWSVGALMTVVLAFAVTSSVSLAWHVDLLMLLCWVGTTYSTLKVAPILLKGSSTDDPNSKLQVRKLWNIFKSDKLIGVVYVSSVMLEFSTNDWATLQAHQEIGASKTLSILPYLLFMIGMIAGRLGIHKLLKRYPERVLIKIFTATGGLSFIVFLQIALRISSNHFALAFVSESLGFFMGGLGGSFMAGVITQISSKHAKVPGALVFAQLQIVTAILTLLIKLVITSVVNLSSITNALVIPGLLMISVAFYPNLTS